MNLTRNQKRCASVLGVCLLAFVVDRLLLAPGAADAGEPGTTAATTPPPTATNGDRAPTLSIPRKQLAERFAALAEEHEIDPANVADPFRVPTAWLPDDGTTGSPESNHPDAETFGRTHRLNAVMALKRGGYAIVDGRRLRIGQQIDGFELVEIRARSIVLESSTIRVELKLSDTGGLGDAPR